MRAGATAPIRSRRSGPTASQMGHMPISGPGGSLAQLAELRAASRLPIDLYVESPDALGGVVRGNEMGDLISAGAPLYVKFGLRNSRALYPSGEHLVADACAIAREKVHRAAVALEWLRRLAPDRLWWREGCRRRSRSAPSC